MLDLTRLWARLFGLTVAVAVAAAATQLLTLGFETTPLVAADTARSLTGWIRRPPLPGPGILAAVAITLGGFTALVGTLWPRRGPSSITIRRRGGWTRIDRRSMEAAIQRRLETLDRRSDITTRVRRTGRVDVDVVSIDAQVDGPAAKVRDALEDLCLQRGLPCKPGTITINARATAKKRRHTIQ